MPPAPPVTSATREGAIGENNTMARVDASGPQRLPSSLVLTFDNLGEASALERGEQRRARPDATHR